MPATDLIYISEEQGFAKSDLWNLQREYFERQGVAAWHNQVPFYVTSNCYIAASYAKTALAMMNDWLLQHPSDSDAVFNIVELGTGSGQFSYYFLAQMQKLLSGMQNPPRFRYIMTDFTASNLNFWHANPQFEKFVTQGVLDFALFNMEQDTELDLVVSGEKIQAGSLQAPLTVIGNYIFDSVSSDAFAIKSGKASEVTLKLSCAQENLDENNRPNKLNKLHVTYGKKKITEDFFADNKLNALLQEYCKLLPDSHVTIPTAGIRTLNVLQSFSSSGMLLISSDKSYTDVSEYEGAETPTIAFHHSFSFMVNYDAIARYFSSADSVAVLPAPVQGLRTIVLTTGINMNVLPNLQQQAQSLLQQFTPEQFFNIYRTLKTTHSQYALPELVAFLDLSYCDPRVFNKIAASIYNKVSSDYSYALKALPSRIDQVLKNFYSLPNDKKLYFHVGLLFHGLGNMQQAEFYYLQSLQTHPEHAATLYNLALTAQNLRGNKKEIKSRLEECLQIDPKFELAITMRDKL